MAVPTKIFISVALLTGFALHLLAPEYLLYGSRWKTIAITYFAQVFAFAVWSIVIYPKFVSPLRKLPSPPGGSFLMGHHRRIIAEPSGEPQRAWSKQIPNDGLIYYRSALNAERVLITTTKGLAEVMVQKTYDFIKPDQIIESIGRILGIGVLFAEGDEHKRQRKILAPAFSFRHIKNLYPYFWAKSVEMVKCIEASLEHPDPNDEKPKGVIEVGEWANRTTLDVIGTAGLDQDFKALQDPSNELYQTYQRMFRPNAVARFMGLLTIFLPYWFVRALPVKRNGEVEESSRFIRATCHEMIRAKKAKLAKGDTADVDILSVALQSGGFTDEELVHQLMTFLAAGHETTASALNWAVYLLCKHPAIQTRLRDDIRAAASLPSVHASTPQPVTAADIERIPYLSAVCNEVLRLFPPVPFTMRIAAQPTSIQGVHIPKGTTVILSPLMWNHDPDQWGPDAEQFNPDRWMGPGRAQSGGAASNYAFMTFLHGPRSCIGQGFAKAEFMCLLAAWVMAFETELLDKERVVEVQGGVTTRPKGGLQVRLTPLGE